MIPPTIQLKPERFTLLEAGRPHHIQAYIAENTVHVSSDTLKGVTGWERRPEGLCRDGMCIVIPASLEAESEFGLDLRKVARLLQRPLALDLPHRVGVLGVSAAVRAQGLSNLEAPDFTLPDLDGELHTLSDYRGKKVLLIAYASW